MKIQLRFLIFVTFNLFITNCYAQLLEVSAWNTFDGRIGSTESQLSLYLFSDNTIKGNYVIKKNGEKILLVGHLKANAIFLTELKYKSGFKGNSFTDTLDKFEGTWTDSLKNMSLPFYFTLSTINWGDYEHRYSDVLGSTEEVEGFMKQVKNAILSNDKEWIANHMHYPTRHVLNKGFTSINNKYQFIKYYNQIFTKKFKDKIKSDLTTNLFDRNGEVMLGSGEIWIGNSTSKKNNFLITAINP